jgi:hypothetical protein
MLPGLKTFLPSKVQNRLVGFETPHNPPSWVVSKITFVWGIFYVKSLHKIWFQNCRFKLDGYLVYWC